MDSARQFICGGFLDSTEDQHAYELFLRRSDAPDSARQTGTWFPSTLRILGEAIFFHTRNPTRRTRPSTSVNAPDRRRTLRPLARRVRLHPDHLPAARSRSVATAR